jgi:sugar transferase EpsL
MSLVGPRPSLQHEARLYDSWQKQRFLVKPGLTGLYQVTARNRVPIREMIRIDIDYVRDQSFTLDLYILTHTPAAMFRGL